MAGTNLFDMIMGAAGNGAVQQMGQQFGLSDSQTQGALKALLPAISGGLKRNAAEPQGLEALLGALDRGHHDRYLDEPERMQSAESVTDGNAILGHLLGSKDMSRQVAAHASQRTGVDTGILKKMLPLVATLAMGSLSKQSKQPGMAETMVGALLGGSQNSGGLAGLAGQMLGGGGRQQQSAGSAGGLGALLGAMMNSGQKPQPQQRTNLGMLGSLLDADGDGNAMDDIFNMVLKR